ncbi:MAG: ferrous iron transport protein B [Ignavibacteriae bacterium]|nr:ferrous iron transport protein B [Ignavibacteriota bacterium]
MRTKNIALVGQPNAGKSTLFNVLSDIKTSTSNFSGTTVKLKESQINIYGDTYNLIDLPGVYSLNPTDEVEKHTYQYLLNSEVDLIINVVDASLLSRSLEMTVELAELGMPVIVALNMLDEADKHGLKINPKKLEEILNVPVVPTVALYGKGGKELVDRIYEVSSGRNAIPYFPEYTKHLEHDIEKLIARIKPKINGLKGSSRFYAIKSIENPSLLPKVISDEILEQRNLIELNLTENHHKDVFETIHYERHHQAMKIAEQVSSFVERKKRPFSEKLDDWLLHPIIGYIFLIGFFILYFAIIFIVGSLIGMAVDAPIQALGNEFAPLKATHPFLWHTLNGAFMGFAGIFGIVLPYFLPLVFLTTIFEDLGYLSRVAFLIDGIMHKIGLHGKSVVPIILGFGCSIPALYATRLIDNKRDKMVTGVLIPFIPCSARISVIFAMAAAFTGPLWAIFIFAYLMIVIAVSGRIMTLFLKKPTGFVMEIPSLKIPSITYSFRKTWFRIRGFLKDASLFLMGGSIILGWMEYFNLGNYVNIAFAPVVKYVLGLPAELGSTLIFGFLRKELILVMMNQAMNITALSQLPLTIGQVVVFIIFVSLYFPCLTTFVVLWKELGFKGVFLSSITSIIVATISAFLFKLVLNV